MAMTATDPHSMGRNFAGHYSRREWNVVPVSSVIEIQFAMAPGTALVQNGQAATASPSWSAAKRARRRAISPRA